MIYEHFPEISYLYLPTHLYHETMNSTGAIDMGHCDIANVYKFWVYDINDGATKHAEKTKVIMKKILG
jgi:hypothetical protein